MWVKDCLSLFQHFNFNKDGHVQFEIGTAAVCGVKFHRTKKLSPFQHKSANCFSFVLQYLGSSSVWPIILIIFLVCAKNKQQKC